MEDALAEVEPLLVTVSVARIHAEIWAALEATGEMIDGHDLWIAATALTHNLRVATTNVRHFERVPGLDVLAV